MARAETIHGDLHCTGTISSKTITLPSSTVDDDSVEAAAGIQATKLQQQYSKFYAQESDTTSATEDYCIHCVHGSTGTVVAFEAGSVTACVGDSTITVDLHKDGASILTAAITLDSSNAAYTPEAGTIDSASIADSDVLEVVVVATVGTGTLGKGVYASCIIREDPS